MTELSEVAITLTKAQVRDVVRGASVAAGSHPLSALLELKDVVLPLLRDSECSRSTLRGLLVLAAVPIDGSEREVTDIANHLGISASTTYRYLNTWVAVGLVDRDPRSRRYRRTR